MDYKIIDKNLNEETITTTVEYTFDNGKTVQVAVAHFRPTSLTDIEEGILNRGVSEQAKAECCEVCKKIMEEIKC